MGARNETYCRNAAGGSIVRMRTGSFLLFKSVVFGSLLCLFCTSVAAADTVRVTKQQAVVRLNPEGTSAVVAQVNLGTVLDVRSRQGSWYSVLLPPDSQGLRRSGFIAADDVEQFETAMTPQPTIVQPNLIRPSPPAPDPSGAMPIPRANGLPPDWQNRYEMALSEKSSGNAKIWTGVGLTSVSVVFGVLYQIKPDTFCSYA